MKFPPNTYYVTFVTGGSHEQVDAVEALRQALAAYDVDVTSDGSNTKLIAPRNSLTRQAVGLAVERGGFTITRVV